MKKDILRPFYTVENFQGRYLWTVNMENPIKSLWTIDLVWKPCLLPFHMFLAVYFVNWWKRLLEAESLREIPSLSIPRMEKPCWPAAKTCQAKRKGGRVPGKYVWRDGGWIVFGCKYASAAILIINNIWFACCCGLDHIAVYEH